MGRKKPEGKPIDCIRMKREIQAEIRKATRGMTIEEELRYFEDAVAKGPFPAYLKQRRAQRPRKPATAKP